MNNIGNNIKQVRVSKKLTQQEVADQLYVTRQCISRWENGKTIPDIESLEKLATIYEITIGEILDEDAIKYLTLQDARELKKWQKYSLIYGIVSLALFLFIFMGIMWLRSDFQSQDSEIVLYNIDAEITAIDDDAIILDTENAEEITFDISKFNCLIYDEYNNEIQIDELEVGNIINISYDKNFDVSQITNIQILDHIVDESLYGIVFNTTEVLYEDYEDMPLTSDPSGLRYVKITSLAEWQHNLQTNNFKISSTQLSDYRDLIVVDITIYMDYRYFTDDAKIGLITSNGIEYIDTINPYYNTTRQYEGEIQLDRTYRPNLSSIDVIYNVNFINVNAVESFEVYEYDMNHSLLIQTEYDNTINFEYHRVSEDTLYTYIKFGFYEGEIYNYSTVHEFFLGESVEYYYADEYGLVWLYYYKVR